jgi:antitoxin VapB
LYAQKAYNSSSAYDAVVRENALNIKRLTESELLKDLDARGAHADELAEPLSHELEPLERLRGSVKRYDRPTDPVWDEQCDSDEGVSEDFIKDRDQPPKIGS